MESYGDPFQRFNQMKYQNEDVPREIEDFGNLITSQQDNANSFTALLELPPNEALVLLSYTNSPCSSSKKRDAPPFVLDGGGPGSTFQSNSVGILNSIGDTEEILKCETVESNLNIGSSQHLITTPEIDKTALTRMVQEKKVKSKTKKRKIDARERSVQGEKLPYVHVRARRGQATDSHSLAERARREKINARMKLLQDLVPGCSKIAGTALVLDEIINHVQSLQRQVEFLSMKLAAVNPRIEFNLQHMLAMQDGSLLDSNSIVLAQKQPEMSINTSGQHNPNFQCTNSLLPLWGNKVGHNFFSQDGSFLCQNSVNSAPPQSSQLKTQV